MDIHTPRANPASDPINKYLFNDDIMKEIASYMPEEGHPRGGKKTKNLKNLKKDK